MGPVMSQYKENANVFKAFCDESRLKIIELLCSDKETCACVLLEDLSISQSTLSHHMRILVESGLVNSRKDGRRVMYSISTEGAERSRNILENILNCALCSEKGHKE